MKLDPKENTTVLSLREMPKDLVGKLKAAAALEHCSLRDYIAAALGHHVQELEKKGVLPKEK